MRRISQMAENSSLTYRRGRHEVTVTSRPRFYDVRVGDVKIIVSRPCPPHAFLTLDFIFDGRAGDSFYTGCCIRCFRRGKQIDEDEAVSILLDLSGGKNQGLKEKLAQFKAGLLASKLIKLRVGQKLLRRTRTGALLIMERCRGYVKVRTTNNIELILGSPGIMVGDLALAIFVDATKTQVALESLLMISSKVMLVSKSEAPKTLICENNRSFNFVRLLVESIIKNESPAVKVLLNNQSEAI